MNSLVIKNSISTFITSIVMVPVGLITSIILARLLGPSGKGSFDLFFATPALLLTLIGFSLPAGITYFVAKKDISLSQLFFGLFPLIFLQGILALCLLIIVNQTKISSAFLPIEYGYSSIYLIFLILLVTLVMSYLRAIFLGKQIINTLNMTDLLLKSGLLLFLLLNFGAYYWFKYSITVVNIVLGNICVMILLIMMLFRKMISLPTAVKIEKINLKEIIYYSIPCYFSNAIQFLNYRLDIFLVSLFIGTSGLGLYTIAVSIAQLIWLSSNAIATALFPAIASSQHDSINKAEQIAQLTRFVFFSSVVLALAFACLSPLIPLFYGESFRPSIKAMLCLLPGITIFTIANILASFFAGIGKPQKNLIVSTSGVVFSVALDLLLIPKWGIIGASITSSISYSISTILLIIFFVQETHIPFSKLLVVNQNDFITAYQKAKLLFSKNV
jgi:O-antigen/teichoic acid export membrane protein